MPDYRESTVTGHTWQRCKQVVIDNSLNQTPVIRFDEEQVIALDGGHIQRDAGTVCAEYDPARVIPLLSPADGLPTGASITQGEVYAIIYSAYLDAATARDGAQQPRQDGDA